MKKKTENNENNVMRIRNSVAGKAAKTVSNKHLLSYYKIYFFFINFVDV